MKWWPWFIRKYGLLTAFRYWREGRRRGWIKTPEDELDWVRAHPVLWDGGRVHD